MLKTKTQKQLAHRIYKFTIKALVTKHPRAQVVQT